MCSFRNRSELDCPNMMCLSVIVAYAVASRYRNDSVDVSVCITALLTVTEMGRVIKHFTHSSRLVLCNSTIDEPPVLETFYGVHQVENKDCRPELKLHAIVKKLLKFLKLNIFHLLQYNESIFTYIDTIYVYRVICVKELNGIYTTITCCLFSLCGVSEIAYASFKAYELSKVLNRRLVLIESNDAFFDYPSMKRLFKITRIDFITEKQFKKLKQSSLTTITNLDKK